MEKFNKQLGAELSAGKRWQARLNEREGFDLDKMIKEVRHTWQWNDELLGWMERASKQSSLYVVGLVFAFCLCVDDKCWCVFLEGSGQTFRSVHTSATLHILR